jgi:hypothetical protein
MAEIRRIIAALGFAIVGVLRLLPLVFRNLPDRVLVSVGAEHAPIAGKPLFKLELQAVGDGTGLVLHGPDSANVRHGIKVRSAKIAGRIRKIGIQRRPGLIEITQS